MIVPTTAPMMTTRNGSRIEVRLSTVWSTSPM